jgi:FkbM family methyltransferase
MPDNTSPYLVPKTTATVPAGSFRARLNDGIRAFLKTLPRENADFLFRQIKGTCRKIGVPEGLHRTDIDLGGHLLLDVDDGMQRIIYFLGFQEPHINARLLTEFKPGRRIIDVGANIGYYTVLAGYGVGETGKVIACEPNPATLKYITENIRSNNLKNVALMQCAVGASSGNARLKLDLKGLGGSRLLSDAATDTDVVEVPIRSLDEIVISEGLTYDSIDFIKIDTEGAEHTVLTGARQILESSKPNLLIEVDDALLIKLGSSAKEVIALLYSFGYELFDIGTQGKLIPFDGTNIPKHTNLFAVHKIKKGAMGL